MPYLPYLCVCRSQANAPACRSMGDNSVTSVQRITSETQTYSAFVCATITTLQDYKITRLHVFVLNVEFFLMMAHDLCLWEQLNGRLQNSIQLNSILFK